MTRLLAVCFIALSAIYFLIPINIDVSLSSIFLTMATFLFAILTGFFISRQSNRYNAIREVIAEFDGNVSALYRGFEVFGETAKREAGEIIKSHYEQILSNKRWDWHFTRKSSTIVSLGNLLGKLTDGQELQSFRHVTVNNMVASTDALQVARKRMVSLHVERVPQFQWVLITFLGSVLVISVSLIPSASIVIDSALKGAFSTIVVFVMLLLYRLDNLTLFEGTLGEKSARDMLGIISGEK